MERKLKKELAGYFEAPKPERKRAFTRQLGIKKINLFYVVLMQARYISKWVWLFSLAFFGTAILMTQVAGWRYVSMILGFVPFLVMLTVTESTSSYVHGMEELELSARFSLKSIVLARMMMLGLGNFVVLAGVLLMLKGRMQINITYVLAPYFLTAGGGLYLVRSLRSKDSTFACFSLATLVCVLQVYLSWQFKNIFEPANTWLWLGLCIIGIIITAREGYRTIRMTEDLAWN